MFGAGGGTSSYREAEETDLIVLWGSNARETHPIFFHHLLRGVRNGARLYAVDPRRTSSAEWADVWLGLDVGSDIALANALGRDFVALRPWVMLRMMEYLPACLANKGSNSPTRRPSTAVRIGLSSGPQ